MRAGIVVIYATGQPVEADRIDKSRARSEYSSEGAFGLYRFSDDFKDRYTAKSSRYCAAGTGESLRR